MYGPDRNLFTYVFISCHPTYELPNGDRCILYTVQFGTAPGYSESSYKNVEPCFLLSETRIKRYFLNPETLLLTVPLRKRVDSQSCRRLIQQLTPREFTFLTASYSQGALHLSPRAIPVFTLKPRWFSYRAAHISWRPRRPIIAVKVLSVPRLGRRVMTVRSPLGLIHRGARKEGCSHTLLLATVL